MPCLPQVCPQQCLPARDSGRYIQLQGLQLAQMAHLQILSVQIGKAYLGLIEAITVVALQKLMWGKKLRYVVGYTGIGTWEAWSSRTLGITQAFSR